MRIGRKAPIAVVALSLLATCTDLPTEHADTIVAMPVRVDSPDVAELLTEAVVSDGRVVLGSETLGYVDPGRSREADTAINSRSEVCYYLVTYIVLTGEVLEVEFLFCTGGGGGASSCTADQRAIADEYAATLVYPDWSCTKFQHTGITSGTGTHGHSTGFLHDDLQYGMAKVFRGVAHRGVSGAFVTSDWRCPVGHSNLPGGSSNSQHVRGKAADFKAPGFNRSIWETFSEVGRAAGATGISRYGSGSFAYTSHIHIDWR